MHPLLGQVSLGRRRVEPVQRGLRGPDPDLGLVGQVDRSLGARVVVAVGGGQGRALDLRQLDQRLPALGFEGAIRGPGPVDGAVEERDPVLQDLAQTGGLFGGHVAAAGELVETPERGPGGAHPHDRLLDHVVRLRHGARCSG